MTIERTFRDHLIAAGVGNADFSGTGTGWLLVEGVTTDREPVRDRPQIAIRRNGGPPRLMLHDGGESTAYVRVQTIVRGTPNDWYGTVDKVEAIVAALHARTLNVGTKKALVRIEQEPIPLGYTDDERKPMWSLNFMAHVL